MTNGAGLVVNFFFVLWVFPAGLRAVVQTEQTVVAADGDEARLNCRLTQSRDVLQVTWQKVSPEGEKNVATYNKHFGQRVNPDFRDKVKIKDAGLYNSSIVISNVTEQDGGCYLCLFNTYPDGALIGRTCLHLFELHEPVLHVGGSDSTEASVVTCSATGRPAPTVTLSVTQPGLHLSHYNTVSVNNTDSTVTVTTTAVLSGLHYNNAQVGCAVRVLSGQKQVFMMIPEVKQTSADVPGFDQRYLNLILIMILFTLVTCGYAAAVITTRQLQKHINRLSKDDPEKPKSLQRTIIDIHEIKTPLMKHENKQMRQRTSTGKRQREIRPKPSSSTAKRLFYPMSTL